MIKIAVYQESNFLVPADKLQLKLKHFFAKTETEGTVSVAVVGQKTMLGLAKRYLGETRVLHNVLTFRDAEKTGQFVNTPGYLGEIVLCWPKIVSEAKESGKQPADWLLKLAVHGATHLLGIHHD